MTTPGDPGTGPQPPAYGQPPAGQDAYGQAPSAQGVAAYGGHQLAPWGYRVGGALIDGVIVAVPAVLLGVITGSRGVYDVVVVLGALLMGYLNGAQGQTPGKRVVGLKLLREQDGQLLGGGLGVVRYIVHIVDSLACLIGWLFPLWDAKRQTFADKIMSTVVIKV